MRFHTPSLLGFALAAVLSATAAGREVGPPGKAVVLANPVLFVAQVPIPADFATIGSTFANHEGSVARAGRGGDLYIRYGNGTLRNLTREAGFGEAGQFQGAASIAVRDPSLHWSGTKALFSMVVGAPTQQYQVTTHYWQLYEVSGFGLGQTVSITQVANQPSDYNNVMPAYSPDGRILFVSDRPRNGARHLYPQHDEYESTATPTGLWSLDPTTGDLHILNHTPSGAFTPIVDSYGRVLFTRWDHLQRDQQADADALGASYGTFDFADESAGAARLPRSEEVFPEPRAERTDLLAGTNLKGHRFNQFFPWQIRPDGTGEETLNHIGRHEMLGYFESVFDDDSNLVDFLGGATSLRNFFQIAENPGAPGIYFGVDAPEFNTHASGQILKMTSASPGVPADQISFTGVTHPDTANFVGDAQTPPPTHSGFYRDPALLASGTLIAAHTAETRAAKNEGTRANPQARYAFRLRTLANKNGDGYLEADQALTPGIARTVSYYDPDVLVTYSGALWELQPVEVRPRPAPPLVVEPPLAAPEAQVFAAAGVDPEDLRTFLRDNNLALIISRDVTTRDAADRQQPFNLRVPGGTAQTIGASGMVYDISHLQLFQADQLRGIGGMANPEDGRRVLAKPLHDPAAENPPSDGPEGSVVLGGDGSMAAFVPARRALTWQLTAPDGTPVVRERFWVTFQPGEIRVCTSCHGLNSADQVGQPAPTNEPAALATLLEWWATSIFTDGFESGDTGRWSASVGE